MKKTGRIAPAWGIGAIVLDFIVSTFIQIMLVIFYSSKFHYFDDGYVDNTEKYLIFTSAVLSFLVVIILTYIASKLLKKRNWRNEIKATKFNYQYIGFVITLVSIYFMIDLLEVADRSGRVLFFGLVTQTVFTIIVVTYCFRYHKQITQSLQIDESTPVILFLRSFDNAKKVSRNFPNEILGKVKNTNIFEFIIFGYTFDQVITTYLNKEVGSTIALGDPNDYLPEVGASKIYMPDSLNYETNAWWEEATRLMEKVRLNIVFESGGESTMKELNYIKDNLSSEKIILITYPSSYKVKEWRNFHSICKQSGIGIPLDFPGHGVVISFDDRWNYIVSFAFDSDVEKMVTYIKKTIKEV